MTLELELARAASSGARATGVQYRDDDGVLWWSSAFACAQLGISRDNLKDWVRRAKAGRGFPPIDPPRRFGNTAAYRAEQLIEAEAYTATATRGRMRRSA